MTKPTVPPAGGAGAPRSTRAGAPPAAAAPASRSAPPRQPESWGTAIALAGAVAIGSVILSAVRKDRFQPAVPKGGAFLKRAHQQAVEAQEVVQLAHPSLGERLFVCPDGQIYYDYDAKRDSTPRDHLSAAEAAAQTLGQDVMFGVDPTKPVVARFTGGFAYQPQPGEHVASSVSAAQELAATYRRELRVWHADVNYQLVCDPPGNVRYMPAPGESPGHARKFAQRASTLARIQVQLPQRYGLPIAFQPGGSHRWKAP